MTENKEPALDLSVCPDCECYYCNRCNDHYADCPCPSMDQLMDSGEEWSIQLDGEDLYDCSPIRELDSKATVH